MRSDRGREGKGEQEHHHPSCKDKETTEVGNTTSSEDVAATVIVAITLGVWIVEVVVRLWDIHREGTESPFCGVGCECKLEKKKRFNAGK